LLQRSNLAQLTKDATHRIYIYKDIKVARKSLQVYRIKCSMKWYLKVIGGSYYTCLPRTLLAAARSARKTAAPGTAPKAPRLLTIIKHSPHIHTCITRTNYKKTVQHYMETAYKTSLKLFYASQRSRAYKEHLKRS
jgi:hypothetical protein